MSRMLNAIQLKDLIQCIVNYIRRSRQDEELEKRTGEDTLKSQTDLMDRALTPLGIPYVQELEIGSGDKISTRPVFKKVIEDLRTGKYQAIAVKEISRMGRGSYTDMGIIYDLLIEKRIFIITPWKIYDPKNPADLKQIRFELFMSREEFETTRERLTGGRYNSAMAGRWVAGKAPFGYQINKTTRKLEIHEEDAQIVRIIFDLFTNGIPDENGKLQSVRYRALATYLKRKGIRTPKGTVEWRPDNLKYLLTNEAYIGTLRYRQTETINGRAVRRPEEEHVIVYNAHQPIIDEDTWNRTQIKANDYSYNPRVKMDFKPYELTGLFVCNVCGRKMIRQESNQSYTNKKSEETKVYHKEFLFCVTSSCTMVKYRAAEEALLETLQFLKELDPDLIVSTLKPMIAESNEVGKSSEDIIHYVERRTKELKQRMKFVFDQFESGRYTNEMFDERKAEIDKELEQLKEMDKTNSPTETNTGPRFDADVVKKELTSAYDNYLRSTDRSEKNEILREVFDHVRIEVIEKGRGSIPAKFNIYPKLKLKKLFG